ncbi:hypothetical protein ADT25_03155 [Xanthomonas oryzae]|uniref:Uncharacterized protein n=1 Tax=Xanthomonas oryzae TaxID=347 RepID=A0AAP1EZW1_9XANT|nr:hypothetical protein ADT25_03155 [Xanthomonas oryzae]
MLPGGSQNRQNVAKIAPDSAFFQSLTCKKLEFERFDGLFRPSLTAWEALMPRGSVPLKVLVRPGLTAALALLT